MVAPVTTSYNGYPVYSNAPANVIVPTRRPLYEYVQPTAIRQPVTYQQPVQVVPNPQPLPNPVPQPAPTYVTPAPQPAPTYVTPAPQPAPAYANPAPQPVPTYANPATANNTVSYTPPSPSKDYRPTASISRSAPQVDPIVTGVTPQLSPEKPTPVRTGISEFRWPVKGRVVSSFGESVANRKNEGIDISVPEGTAVRASENGVVIYAGNEISAYGNLVLVRHDDNWVSAYAHNREFAVKKGDTVRRGQIIARSGRTGDASSPKLHFELRKNSVPVDPKLHLANS